VKEIQKVYATSVFVFLRLNNSENKAPIPIRKITANFLMKINAAAINPVLATIKFTIIQP